MIQIGELPNGLTKEEKEIIIATSNTKIKDIHRHVFNKEIGFEIGKLALTGGFVNLKTDFLLEEVTNIIIQTYQNLTIEEIKTAWRRGIYLNYGEYVGLSAVNLVRWLDGYIAEKNAVLRRVKELTPLPKDKQIELSKQERNNREYLALEEFIAKEKKIPIAWGWSSVYEHLESTNQIKMTTDEKKHFAEIVKEKEKRKAEVKMLAGELDAWKKCLANFGSSEDFAGTCRKYKVIEYLELNNVNLQQTTNL